MSDVSTRLQKEQRGFYKLPERRLYAVNSSFEKAKKQAADEAKVAGAYAALLKLGLLKEQDPVSLMSKGFRGHPIAKPGKDGSQRGSPFGPASPALGGGGTFERTGLPQFATGYFGGA